MPVNSFDDYPMSWTVSPERLTPPMYLSLAKAIEEDIERGILTPNTKLPPQRELADYLDINVSTVTRAFKLCEVKGVLYGTIGKGTFVSSQIRKPVKTVALGDSTYIDMGQIRPFYQFNDYVSKVANEILQQNHADTLFEFMTPPRERRYKQAAQKWLSAYHMNVPTSCISMTSGTQNAFVAVFLSFFQVGDKIAVDAYSYPNFIRLAKQCKIQLVAIDGDAFGMSPENLEMNCRINNIKGVYLVPSCNNPTAADMPDFRRQEIAQVIKENNLLLIEDATYAFLTKTQMPIASLLQQNYIYISGTSKALCAGLRIAFLAVSEELEERMAVGMQNINLQVPLLNLEIITTIIESNLFHELVTKRLQLAKERNAVFTKYFPLPKGANLQSYFQWIELPKGCNGYNFELQAKKEGVIVLCSDRFVVGPSKDKQFIRLSLCSVENTDDLHQGLITIKRLIQENIPPTPDNTLII